jgi:hypothetical protein
LTFPDGKKVRNALRLCSEASDFMGDLPQDTPAGSAPAALAGPSAAVGQVANLRRIANPPLAVCRGSAAETKTCASVSGLVGVNEPTATIR